MTSASGPQNDDVEAVGRFVDAHRAFQAAAQRVGKARDAVAQVHQPVRDLDQAAVAAQRRIAAIAAAEAAAAERDEAVAQVRDAAVQNARDRTAAQGRGPAARAARARLAESGYDSQVRRERIGELTQRAQQAAEAVGVPDRSQWAELRQQDQELVDTYRERRRETIEAAGRRYPQARAELDRAEAAITAVGDQREAAAADLSARGIDPDRVATAADRIAREGRAPAAGDDRTGPALEAWQERQRYERRARELDDERRERGPCNGTDRER